KDNIWAIDGKSRNVMQYTDAGWGIVRKGEAVCVAAGVDGTVIVINEVGKSFSYIGDGNWEDIPGVRLARIATGDAHDVWGVGVDGELFMFTGMVHGRTVATKPTAPTPPPTTESPKNKWRKRVKKA